MPFWRSGRGRGAGAGRGEDVGHVSDAGQGGDAGRAEDAGRAGPESLPVDAAIRRIAEQDTPENRRALFELLAQATLFAAVVDPFVPGGEHGLATLPGEDGPVLPVFTRVDALLAWRPTGYRHVALLGLTVFETAARDRIARIEVNPASVPRGWISRTEIEALAEGRMPSAPAPEPAAPAEPQVGRPAVKPPAALIEAARRALEEQPHAVAGWLFETVQEDGARQLMIGVQLARGLDQAATEETMQGIVEGTWARSTDAHQLRFMLVAQRALYRKLVGGAGERIFKR